MRILMVNKFLYPKGGAETYVFKLGKILEDHGHEVQYFGIEDARNIVGNNIGAYAKPSDFQKGMKKNLLAPFKIIYSRNARQQMQRELEDFQPDVVHLNNIQFHLTPSIMLAVNTYRRKYGRNCRLVYTAHDFQLICPSHGLFDVNLQPCEMCLSKHYWPCLQKKCVKNSRLKSLLGMMDAYYWKYSKAYSYIDTIVCPSEFMKKKLDIQARFADKTVVIHNFVDKAEYKYVTKENYVLEFGHLSKDKGTETLLQVCRKMSDTRFLFAGYGESVDKIKEFPNAEYVGFQSGEALEMLIRKAAVSVVPSECNENCSFSVIESQMYLTPVLGSRMGGTPELIEEGKTGELFEAGNTEELEEKLRYMLSDNRFQYYSENCKSLDIETPETYYAKLLQIYKGDQL